MNALTIVVLLAIVVWWYKPLRVYLVQRTNRTVKVLLIVFPLLYAGRLAWRFYSGEQDDLDVVTITVFALLIAWALPGLADLLPGAPAPHQGAGPGPGHPGQAAGDAPHPRPRAAGDAVP